MTGAETLGAIILSAVSSGLLTHVVAVYGSSRKDDKALEATNVKEDTAKHRITTKDRADQRDAIERQLDRRNDEHADCVARVDALSNEVLDLSVNLARCEARHANVEVRLARLEGQSEPPIDYKDDEVTASMRSKGSNL